jgi:FkbM family methyltransferase
MDFLWYGQFRLLLASAVYIIGKKSILDTRVYKGKLGYFLHRKGSLDFQFGNYAYEWSVKQFINKHFNAYQHFFDIGSNIGTYSIFTARKGMSVIAFEPIYENFKALNINILLNDLEKNVQCINYGLSDIKTEAEFAFDPMNTGASHLSSIPAEFDYQAVRSISEKVKLVRLDDLFEEFNIPLEKGIMVKIDVEGMEGQVLKGSKNFIQKYEKLLFVIESIHSGEENLKAILNEMAVFEFYPIDALNFGAKKIGNHK